MPPPPPPPISRPLTRTLRHIRPPLPQQQRRFSSSTPPPQTHPGPPTETPSPTTLLSTPTWSVRSLLPPSTPSPSSSEKITPSTLHHLLRLSSLPPPTSPSAETAMLATLHAQLHFVRAIQQVDTQGIAPLTAIRDETRAGVAEATIGLGTEEIREALAGEEAVGRCRRPRRSRNGEGAEGRKAAEEEGWDVLGQAGERAGGYFVVRGGKTGMEGEA